MKKHGKNNIREQNMIEQNILQYRDTVFPCYNGTVTFPNATLVLAKTIRYNITPMSITGVGDAGILRKQREVNSLSK